MQIQQLLVSGNILDNGKKRAAWQLRVCVLERENELCFASLRVE